MAKKKAQTTKARNDERVDRAAARRERGNPGPAPSTGSRVTTGPRTGAAATTPARTAGIKVMATRLGYYNERRQRAGSVFFLNDAADFSTKWMKHVGGDIPAGDIPGKAAIPDELLEESGDLEEAERARKDPDPAATSGQPGPDPIGGGVVEDEERVSSPRTTKSKGKK